MKKYISHITLLAVCVPFLFSCEDNRGSGMVSDKLYLRKHGIHEVSAYSLNKGEVKYDLWAYKGGNLATSGKVEFVIDPQLLIDYNENHPLQEPLSVLPAGCYTIPGREFNVSGDNPAAKFYFTYNPDVIVNSHEAGRKYALPLRIKTTGIEVNEEQSSAMIIFDINFMKIGFLEHPSQVRDIKKGDALFNEKLTLVLPGEAPEDANVTLTFEESYVTAYNDEFGTNYKILPVTNYSFDNAEPVFPKGANSMSVPFRVNIESLPAGEFMLPVVIASVSGLDVDQERNVFYFMYRNSDEWLVTAADKENWKFVNVSTVGPDGSSGLDKLIDGVGTTYWGVAYGRDVLWDATNHLKPGSDQWMILDLGSKIKVGSVKFSYRGSSESWSKMNVRLLLNEQAPDPSAYIPSYTSAITEGASPAFIYNGAYTVSTVSGELAITDKANWIEATNGVIEFAGGASLECLLDSPVEGRYMMVVIPYCMTGLAIAEIDILRIK